MAKRKIQIKYIIGIDEVGRGALAGPVTVAAVAAPKDLRLKISAENGPASDGKDLRVPLRDSKKLNSKQREVWFNFIKKSALCYGIASVSPKIIDKINISNAANLAATRAFVKLIANCSVAKQPPEKPLPITKIKIFLDGGLYLNKKILTTGGYTLNPKTIIKGDEKIPAISLASIVAKVTRDRYMKKLHKKYPKYDFINNVGYGTDKHTKAIKKFGRSPAHRKSFKIG